MIYNYTVESTGRSEMQGRQQMVPGGKEEEAADEARISMPVYAYVHTYRTCPTVCIYMHTYRMYPTVRCFSFSRALVGGHCFGTTCAHARVLSGYCIHGQYVFELSRYIYIYIYIYTRYIYHIKYMIYNIYNIIYISGVAPFPCSSPLLFPCLHTYRWCVCVCVCVCIMERERENILPESLRVWMSDRTRASPSGSLLACRKYIYREREIS